MPDDFLQRLAARPAASPLAFDLRSRRCHVLDLSAANAALAGLDPADTARLAAFVEGEIGRAGADYGAGGWGEDRALYRLSPLFATADGGRRCIHLGIDLWCAAGTGVHAMLDGRVHSARDNATFGDYGPTLILEHEIDGRALYVLYGHLSRDTLAESPPGRRVAAGERLGRLGHAGENLGWPPHLHLQLVTELGGHRGDFPGVCTPAQAPAALARCPDPNLLLRIDALAARR